MSLQFTTEQNMLRDSIAKITGNIATRDYLAKMDREGLYPYEVYDALVNAGAFAMPFGEAYGGLGGSIVDTALIVDALSYVNYDLAVAYLVVLYTATTLSKCAREEQKRHYLPKIFDGSIRMSVSISEPQAGSDVSAIRTSARRDGDSWVLNGQKVWATAAGARNGVIQLFARTDTSMGPRGGLTEGASARSAGVRWNGRRPLHPRAAGASVPLPRFSGEEKTAPYRRAPNSAEPTRTEVAPKRMAVSKSALIPIDSCSNPLRRAISASSAKCGPGGSPSGGMHINPSIARP